MKKGIKKILCMMAVFCLLAASILPVHAATPTEAKNSVVCIGISDSNGQLIGWGSGFAIGKPGKPIQYIVTNCHVAEPTDEEGNLIPCVLTVYFSAAANRSMKAEVYWRDAQKDLAVLKLPEETTEREAMVLCPMNKVNMDDEFAALGYPATSMAADFVKFDKTDISITKGGISKQVRVNGSDCYLLDIKISQGNSGGPLVNSKGEVVGVNTFMLNDEARYAVAIDELIRSISPQEIPYTLSGESFSKNVLIIGGIAAAVVILIIILIVVLGKKKRPAAAAASPVPAAPVQAVPVQPANVGGTGGQMQQTARFQLVSGLASPLSGRLFQVDKELVIGRNGASCDIAFPVDTRGVSARHCKITPTENGIILSDLNSSYGTFLVNGTKVEPGQNRILRSGDSFYLGGEDNRFEVR